MVDLIVNQEKYKIEFMIKNILGRDIDFSNVNSIVLKCIEKAYIDMLSGGRFYINQLEGFNKKSIVNKIKTIFDEFNYRYSIDMLNETLSLFGDCEIIKSKNSNNFVTRLGLSQKIINMSYKYFYCVNEFLGGLNIDYSLCDCPIDSIVLNYVGNNSKWTKLKMQEYLKVQDDIRIFLKENYKEDYEVFGNLLLDFIAW